MLAETQTALAIYLYGFGSPELIAPAMLGVDDTHPISVHACAGVNALISSVAIADFTGESGEQNLQNVAWLTPRACRHALVIDKCLARTSVYPVAFGTLFSTVPALEQEMQRYAADVLAILAQINGCEEWALEATLDRQHAVDALLTEGLQSGRFTLPDSVGRRHLEEQKLRRLLHNELHTWLEQCLTALQQELSALARKVRARRLVDDKVLHWAYLLPVENVTAFQAQVADITKRYQNYGFSFRMTGPWAAYSFCHRAEL